MTIPNFEQLRLSAHSASAQKVIDRAEANGASVGEAALELIATGHSPYQQSEAAWRAQHAGSTTLQAEFPNADAYVALRRHEQRSRQ